MNQFVPQFIAAALNDIDRGPSQNLVVSIRVNADDVSSLEPALSVECLFGRVRLVQVTLEYILSL